MNKIRSAILALVISALSTIASNAQTVDEIIQKHLAATGGADNWKKINSIKKNCVRNAGGVEIPVIITVVAGKGYRNESTMNGMTSYTIITEKEGWAYNPRRGQTADALSGDVIRQGQDRLDPQGPLIDYKDKGYKVISLGADDVEGTECYKLKVTMPWGKEETIFIDASNFYLVRTSEKVKANGKEWVQTATYGDYEKLPEGIIYPMSVDGLTIKSIEINKPVDEKMFKPAASEIKK
jgi:hypothetical protein